jgi:hypothetical protein
MLSDIIKTFGGVEATRDLVPGIVGEGAAVEFAAYVTRALREREIEEIIASPADATLPNTLDGIYVLTSWLASYARSRPELTQAASILLTRIPPEFAIVLARDMIHASPAFVRESGYKTFIQKHGRLISG